MGHELNGEDLKRSAIVFSPHFDDETLGCGGTILKKKKLGASVRIVFMTDGSKSHKDFVSEDALRAMRASEGLAAAQMLGLDARDVLTLDFEETKLQDHAAAATHRVGEILLREHPQDVFVPSRREPPPDHAATHGIVTSALRKYDLGATVYEYPIWLWQHWPWTSVANTARRRIGRVVRDSVVSSVSLLGEFRWRVYIGDVMAEKQAALDRYRSQMTRLNCDSRWPILSDVSDGEFLECFFQRHESFVRRTFPMHARG